jgi:MFS transporter, DHA3 family, macrolide efflux protein
MTGVEQRSARGFPYFVILWLGQFISLAGAGLTTFSVGIHVYRTTGSVTSFALVALFGSLPGVLVSPIAGVYVDRWNRRTAVLVADVGAGFATTVIMLVLADVGGALWQIYLCTGLLSVCTAFQWPAYSAAVTQLVPKEQLGRANGLVQVGEAIGQIAAPALAGLLMTIASVDRIILIDVATYAFAIVATLLVRVPAVDRKERSGVTFFEEMTFGWNYIWARTGLAALLLFIAANNFTLGILQPLLTPLVLGFASPRTLGNVLSVAGLGMLAGGVAMAVWGGPKKQVNGVLGFTVVAGVAMIAGGLRPSALLVGAAGFALMGSSAVIVSCSQTIWQKKVEHAVQGRVFAVRRMIAQLSWPVGALAAGPLADRLFEPLLSPEGRLASSVGRVIGVGPGRGIALLFTILGCALFFIAARGYAHEPLRRIESDLPDAALDRPESLPEATADFS